MADLLPDLKILDGELCPSVHIERFEPFLSVCIFGAKRCVFGTGGCGKCRCGNSKLQLTANRGKRVLVDWCAQDVHKFLLTDEIAKGWEIARVVKTSKRKR